MITAFAKGIAVAVGCVVLAACAKKESYTDTTKMVDTTTAAAAIPAPPPAPPALTDANIAALLDGANAADSTDGKLASTKGTNADVRAFGKQMMTDHHMLRKQGLDLVKALNVTPEMPAGSTLEADAKLWTDSLKAMPKGTPWDKAYIDHEIVVHEMVLSTIDRALSATQTPDLRALLEKARPAVQGHLDRAKAIQAKLSTGA